MVKIPDIDDKGLRQSLWAATAEPAPDCPPLAGVRKADVLVVGAGFTGLSAALHLAEKGVDVVVLEAVEPGWGASGRNGGQVISGLKDNLGGLEKQFRPEQIERMKAFARTTADTPFDLIERHGIECDAVRAGWIQGAHGPAAADQMRRKAETQAAAGGDVAFLNADEVEGLTGTGWYHGAFLDRRGGTLQPLSYARGLARAAIAAGADIYGQSPVSTLEKQNGAWLAKTESGASCRAGKVLLCTNGYSDLANLVPQITQSVVPFYSYQCATAPLSDNLRKSILTEGHGVSETRRVLSYFRLDSEGRFLLGARGAMDGSLEHSAFNLARERLAQLFPVLRDEPLEYFWNGRVAITSDHLPRFVEPSPGLYAALGWNGRGVAMTSAMGPALADWLTGAPGEDLPIPVTKVRPIPFHGLRLVAAQAIVSWSDFQDKRERNRSA
ncbi:MAG: FAD-binding oxidoreductase [Alphaproteobacteria bacterium]